MKPIISIDFDGVIHSYTSGWKGPRTIPDEPVPGALEFLVHALDCFNVAIFSSRSRYIGGRRAMKRWLHTNYVYLGTRLDTEVPSWWSERICADNHMDPWYVEVDRAANEVVTAIKWPLFKPPATIGLDDRVLTFDGTFPPLKELQSFRPWNRR